MVDWASKTNELSLCWPWHNRHGWLGVKNQWSICLFVLTNITIMDDWVSMSYLSHTVYPRSEVFPCSVVYISCHLVSCTPHNQHFHFWFRPFAGKITLSSKSTGKRNHLVHFDYCHYVLKYLMRDMLNYHCLWVFRSRVRRIGKHSPGFSVFRTRVHGCSDAELAVFRPRAPSGRFFFLAINISHARQVINEVWGN